MRDPMGRDFLMLVVNSGNWVMQHPFEVSVGIFTGAEATAIAWWQNRRAKKPRQQLEKIPPKVQGSGLNQPESTPVGNVIEEEPGKTAESIGEIRKENRPNLPGQPPSDSPPRILITGEGQAPARCFI